jgi:GNAT superfamily N-acetyltransferase
VLKGAKITTFVAKHAGKVVGFVEIKTAPGKVPQILRLATHEDYRLRRVGRKLLGTANAYLLNKNYKFSELMAREGTERYYARKTNYNHRHGQSNTYFAPLKKSPRVRVKPKQKPLPLSPQNLMNPLKIRRRRI